MNVDLPLNFVYLQLETFCYSLVALHASKI